MCIPTGVTSNIDATRAFVSRIPSDSAAFNTAQQALIVGLVPPTQSSTNSIALSLIKSTNQMLVTKFYEYMKNNGCSEKHINNTFAKE
jgi:hypothetical protein